MERRGGRERFIERYIEEEGEKEEVRLKLISGEPDVLSATASQSATATHSATPTLSHSHS